MSAGIQTASWPYSYNGQINNAEALALPYRHGPTPPLIIANTVRIADRPGWVTEGGFRALTCPVMLVVQGFVQ
jgi:hypothetical protein